MEVEVEVEKRKRFGDEGVVEGKKVKAKVRDENRRGREGEGEGEGEGITTAVKGGGYCRNDDNDDDEEVEEFYAILRRIHVAVKYFEKSKCRNGKKKNPTATATAMPWSPKFEREDFEGGNSNGVKGEENVGDNVGLDLNAEPDPDSE